MKWDIDRAMAAYEPVSIPGTLWQRVLMQVSQARREGLRVPPELKDSTVDVMTRQADALTNNIATGYAKIVAKYWDGRLEF